MSLTALVRSPRWRDHRARTKSSAKRFPAVTPTASRARMRFPAQCARTTYSTLTGVAKEGRKTWAANQGNAEGGHERSRFKGSSPPSWPQTDSKPCSGNHLPICLARELSVTEGTTIGSPKAAKALNSASSGASCEAIGHQLVIVNQSCCDWRSCCLLLPSLPCLVAAWCALVPDLVLEAISVQCAPSAATY